MRYADDFVMGFESGMDARQMLADLKDRLAKFGLALHEDNTRLTARSWLAINPWTPRAA